MRSGRYTHNCEAWNNHKGLSPDDPTYDDRIAAAGYRVHNIGRTDYLSGAHSDRARVDAWTRSANIMRPTYHPPPVKMVDGDGDVAERDWQSTDAAVAWLKETAGQQNAGPFKLYLGLSFPHPPFKTSRKYLELIDPDTVMLPPQEMDTHPVTRYQILHKNWTHGLDDDTVREVRRVYYAMVAEVDAMVGRVLDAVAEGGLTESTVIVFSSDHGELALEHGQFFKMSPFEGSARVPLVVSGPGLRKGVAVDTPVSLVDLYPTFMELVSASRPDDLDGHSLLPMLQGAPGRHPGRALCEYHDSSSNATWFLLREGDWKLIHYCGYEPQLFNLRDDPDEVRDLARQKKDRTRKMEQTLRGLVDVDEVDARVKRYEKACFRQWREEQRAAGTYADTMARIFSGFDSLEEEDIRPWTDQDEKQVLDWLEA